MRTNHYLARKTLFVFIVILATSPLTAKLFYSQTEYKNLYNEKVAVELELKVLQRQYRNEKSNLLKQIKGLESDIDTLNKKIENLNNERNKDRDLCDKRIQELEDTIDILKKKSGNR